MKSLLRKLLNIPDSEVVPACQLYGIALALASVIAFMLYVLAVAELY